MIFILLGKGVNLLNETLQRDFSANGLRISARSDLLDQINFSFQREVTFTESPSAQLLSALSPQKTYRIQRPAQDLLSRSLDVSEPLEIVFNGGESQMRQILNRVNDLKTAPVLKIQPLRTKFSIEFLLNFSKEQRSHLYFEFRPFNVYDIDSWTTDEIRDLILQLSKMDVFVRPPPGYDVGCSLDPIEDLLLRPSEPTFELSIQGSLPKWSVIIPSFNNAAVVPAVLWSILSQTLPRSEFEIIFVDDASEDDTELFVRKLIEPEYANLNFKYLKIKTPHSHKSETFVNRAGTARNLGYLWSKGDNILFLDSDTVIDHELIARWSHLIQSHQLLQAPRSYISFNEKAPLPTFEQLNHQPQWLEDENFLKPFYQSEDWQTLHNKWLYVCTYALAVRRQEIEKWGLFRATFKSYGFEDVELGYRWHKNNATFYLDQTHSTLHLSKDKESRRSWSHRILKHYALSKTAKVFFHNTLDLDVYNELFPYMWGESKFLRKWMGKEVSAWS